MRIVCLALLLLSSPSLAPTRSHFVDGQPDSLGGGLVYDGSTGHTVRFGPIAPGGQADVWELANARWSRSFGTSSAPGFQQAPVWAVFDAGHGSAFVLSPS